MSVYVKRCSSCGKDHKDMAFASLMSPVVIDNEEYSFVGQCPETHERIFMHGSTDGHLGQKKDAVIWVCEKCWDPKKHEVLTLGDIGVSWACDICGGAGELYAIWRSWHDKQEGKRSGDDVEFIKRVSDNVVIFRCCRCGEQGTKDDRAPVEEFWAWMDRHECRCPGSTPSNHQGDVRNERPLQR